MKEQRKRLTAPQAAAFVGCSKSFIYQLFALGEIEGYRLGSMKGIRLFQDSLIAFLYRREGEK